MTHVDLDLPVSDTDISALTNALPRAPGELCGSSGGPPSGERYWWMEGDPKIVSGFHRVPASVYALLGGVEYAGVKWFHTRRDAEGALERAVRSLG